MTPETGSDKPRLRVAELFAGVGGFRLGLEAAGGYEVVFSNQYEPTTKKQHASMVYEARFGSKGHVNAPIEEVPTRDIPECDLLVGGFPCQDYSVATTVRSAKGLIGKKGVLWWSIHRILAESVRPPAFLMLENVDRLLKSPTAQRGRDFAIMLRSLDELGYTVEWRVINAADFGMPQRRRRVFLMAYHRSHALHGSLGPEDTWLRTSGCMAQAFPMRPVGDLETFPLEGELADLSAGFNTAGSRSPFRKCGWYRNGNVLTFDGEAEYDGPRTVLGDILEPTVDPAFYIDPADLDKWHYLKGAKQETRTAGSGHSYRYSEGAMVFPDALDAASRTIITGEGGRTPSRFKHVVRTAQGNRRLTPVELERLNMFPDDHTRLEGVSDAKRAFFMGNALVVGIVARLGEKLSEALDGATLR